MTTAPTPPAELRRYVDAVTVLGLVVAVGAALASHGTPTLLAVGATVLAVCLGDLPIVHVEHGGENHTFTWSEAAVVVGLVALPAGWLPLVGGLVIATQHLALRRSTTKARFNGGAFALAAGAATAVDVVVGDLLGSSTTWPALVAACATFLVLNTAAVAGAVARSRDLPFSVVLRDGLGLAILFGLANTSLAVIVAAAVREQPIVLVTVVPVLAQLLVVYRNTREVVGERDLWVRVQGLSNDLRAATPEAIAEQACETVLAIVGAARVDLVLHGPEDEPIHRAAGAPRRNEVHGGVRWASATGPIWLDDPLALGVDGLRSALVVPLEWAGETAGTLCVGFRSRRHATARLESVLCTVASQLAATVATARRAEELRHQAEHDQLTGLPNRTLLERRLGERLARPAGPTVALCFLDLDDFKVVNDSLGHHAGDRLLLDAARRLRDAAPAGSIVARFGGDEFVVVTDLAPGDAPERLGDALLDALAGDEGTTPISASAGIATASGDGRRVDVDGLLRDADAAMYRAKRSGQGSIRIFTQDLHDDAVERHQLVVDLREALDQGTVEVHYQPIVSNATGGIVELEALARWRHPVRGPVSPATFIPLAEEAGLIGRLGSLVLHRACADMRRWRDLGLLGDGQRVAVNLSARQLDDRLPTLVGDALARHGLPASSLTLEVTESALVEDDAAVESLARLRDMGIEIALDDFGTGYSSLGALRDLPVDVVKIDRTFVRDLYGDVGPMEAMIAAIVALAHALDMEVVAEGVEDAAHDACIRELDCDRSQGWYHGRPMSAATVDAHLTATAAPRTPLPRPALRLAASGG